MAIPANLRPLSCSLSSHQASMAVKTGIRFTKTLVRATPILRTTPAKRTNAMTEANTANMSKANNPSDVILLNEKVE